MKSLVKKKSGWQAYHNIQEAKYDTESTESSSSLTLEVPGSKANHADRAESHRKSTRH